MAVANGLYKGIDIIGLGIADVEKGFGIIRDLVDNASGMHDAEIKGPVPVIRGGAIKKSL